MRPTDEGADLRAASPDASAELHNEGVAHEHSDINVRAVLMFAGGLITVAIIVHVAMWLLFGVFEKRAAADDPAVSPVAAPSTAMPRTTAGSPYFGNAAGPQLVTDEPRLLQTLRAREQHDLQGYGWIDQNAGVAKIPVEEAKTLLLQRGLPVRPADQADPHLGTHGSSLGEASSGRDIPIVTQPRGATAPPSSGESGQTGKVQ